MFKEYRKKQGYTQEELAEVLDISTRHMQRIENEEKIPTMELFKKIVKILRINDKDIVTYIKK